MRKYVGIVNFSQHSASFTLNHCQSEFLSFGTTDIWGWLVLCCGGLSCTLSDV